MAKIKFPLKMANGEQVRTFEELRKHFDLASVLGYYDNGRLIEWLTDRYFEDEAEKIKALDSSSGDFKKQLCEILGAPYSEDAAVGLSMSNIAGRNKRRELLKEFTADDKILAAVDRVAFSQEDIVSLLDEDVKEIYLCGEHFSILGRLDGVTYIGVNNPTVDLPEDFFEKNIVLKKIKFINNKLVEYAEAATDPVEAVKWWQKGAEAGIAEAQYNLGLCYENGTGVEKNPEEAVKWYHRAAEQGLAEAQSRFGNAYINGYGVDKNFEEAVKWYRKAVEQGLAVAQNSLGIQYWKGEGVEQNLEEAVKWFHRAAEQGYDWAQHNLGTSYRDGKGVEQNEDEAIKWLRKAYEQGNEEAKKALIEIDSTLFKLPDVLLYAVGGIENISCGSSRIEMASGEINVYVYNRHIVNQTVFEKFGAAYVWMETVYSEEYRQKEATLKNVVSELGLFFRNAVRDKNEPPDIGDMGFETVRTDTGRGVVHIQFTSIDALGIEEDFFKKIESECKT